MFFPMESIHLTSIGRSFGGFFGLRLKTIPIGVIPWSIDQAANGLRVGVSGGAPSS